MSEIGLDQRLRLMAFPRLFLMPQWVIGLAYVVGYILLDWVSFIHPFAPFGITPWNPPTGLSFVLVLMFGQKFIPLLFAAPLLADLLVIHLPFPWTTEALLTVVTGAGYAAGLVVLLRPGTRFNPALTTMRDLIVLMAVAAFSSAFVAASYVSALIAADLLSMQDAISAALQFWVGDMIGITVVAPLALIVLTRGHMLKVSAETAIQILAVIAAVALVFVYGERYHFQLFYVLFLPIIWMAVRGGLELVTTGILVTQIGLILGIQMLSREEINVTAFQALMLVLAMTGLIAGALVTERRRTEIQLRLHQDSLARLARLGSVGELAAAVAHEINQPLMAAGTYTRLVVDGLRSGLRDGESTVESAEKAVSQVERAAEVVRRLRALIRLDQSGRSPTSVERIVKESLELSRPDLERHSITVRVVLKGELPAINVDILQIEQVILNLIRNSIEAIRDAGHGGGAITLSASQNSSGDAIEIAIRDTGPGFPPELLAAELLPLSSAKAEGLGIGLSLCRSIIEAHGGRLRVGGDAGGALVEFTLPMARPSDG
jgi:signal transduction histidine kinase